VGGDWVRMPWNSVDYSVEKIVEIRDYRLEIGN
jgi:hypothetical protein